MKAAEIKAPSVTATALPQKFFPLLWYLIKKTFAAFVKQLPRMLVFGILGWLFHTFLMVFVNEGFASNTLLGGALATQGNGIGGTIVWTVVSGFIFSWVTQMRQKKGKDRFALPPFKTYFTRAGDLALAALVAAAGIAMVIGATVSNIASFALAAGVGGLLLSQGRAIISLLIRSAWMSTYGLAQNKKVAQFGMAAGYVAIVGGAVGFLLNVVIPLAIAKAIIGIVCLAVAFFLTKRSGKTLTATMLFISGFIAIAYVLDAAPLLAHDGGWKEAGGDFIRWIRSEGALEAIIRGLGPGIGILLGPAILQMLRDLTAGLNPEDFEGDDGGWGDDGRPESPSGEDKVEPSGPVIIDYFDGTPLKNWSTDAGLDASGNTGKPGDVMYNGEWMDADTAREKVADDEYYDKRDKAERAQQEQEWQQQREIERQQRNAEADRITQEYERRQAEAEANAQLQQELQEKQRSIMINRLSGDPSLQEKVNQLQAEGMWDEIAMLWREKVDEQMRDSRKESEYWTWWGKAHRVGEVGSKVVLAGSKAALMTLGGPAGFVATAATVGTVSAAQEGAESYVRGDSTTRVIGSTMVGFLSGAKDGAIGRFVNMPGVGRLTKLFVPAAGDTVETYLKARREAGFAPEGKAESQWESIKKATGMGALSIGSDLLGGKIDGLTSPFAREGAKLTLSTVAGGTSSVIQGGTFAEGAQEGLIGGIGGRIGSAAGQKGLQHTQEYEASQRAAAQAERTAEAEERVRNAMRDADGSKHEADGTIKRIPIEEQPEIIRKLNDSRHSQEVTDESGKPVVKQYVDEKKALEQLMDTRSSRTAKQADDDIQRAIMNTRNDKIYAPADEATIKSITPDLEKAGLLKPGDKLVMDTFSTPGKAPSLGADRDARLVILRTDPDTGETVKVEVPRQHWENKAYEDFYNHTTRIAGGENAITPDTHPNYFKRMEELQYLKGSGYTDEQIRHRAWAEANNQVFTDGKHVEASMDYSDQLTKFVNGQPVRTSDTPQVSVAQKGVDTPEARGAMHPGADKRLLDPHGFGQMWEEKSRVYQGWNQPEAVAQAQKGVEQYMRTREGYQAQGYETPPLDARTAKAMEIITRAPVGADATDAAMQNVNKQLQDLGYRDTNDAIGKIATQHEVLKWSKPAGTTDVTPTIKASDIDAATTARIGRSTISPEAAPSGQGPIAAEEKVFTPPDFAAGQKPVSPMGAPVDYQKPSETMATSEPLRGVPEEPAAPTGRTISQEVPTRIADEPKPYSTAEEPAEHVPETVAQRPVSDEPIERVIDDTRDITTERTAPKASTPLSGSHDVDHTSSRAEDTGIRDTTTPTSGARPETVRPSGDIGVGKESSAPAAGTVRGTSDGVSGTTRTGSSGVREDVSGGIREGIGGARDGISGGVREGISGAREGIGGAREGIGSAREGIGGAREGIGSAREGLSQEQLMHEQLDQQQLMQDELLRTREELARQREELARLQEELRRWREQNER